MHREVARRQYLEKLEAFKDRPDLVKVVTGVRGSGKSTLLMQFKRRLLDAGEDAVYVDLEEERFAIATGRELSSRLAESMGSPRGRVLLDEVQLVGGWEEAVDSLRRGGADVYVAGSNAKVLSVPGSVEIRVLPFSFAEFLERHPPEGGIGIEQRFGQFARWGGMPAIDLDDPPFKNRAILEGANDSIAVRGIMARGGLDAAAVRRMTDFIYSNVGSVLTAGALRAGSGMADGRTAARYLEAVTGSFAFCRVNACDLAGEGRPKAKAKYYAADVGLRNAALGHADGGASGILENIVYLELVRRGYGVSVGFRRGREAGLLARIGGRTELYQIAGAPAARGGRRPEPPAGCRETVLTLDRGPPEESGDVRHANLTDFLLGARGRQKARNVYAYISR